MDFKEKHIYFSTFTVNNWTSVFLDFPGTNFICLESFEFLVNKKGIFIYGFVIMRDHIHLIWELPKNETCEVIIEGFKKYTGGRIIKYLKDCEEEYLEHFESARRDRKYKFWKLSTGNLRIEHPDILKQKLKYIHDNPTKGDYKQVDVMEEYLFSSAKAYLHQNANFPFLTVVKGIVL